MKKGVGILFALLLLNSCGIIDERATVGKNYIMNHLADKGLSGTVLDVEKTNGTEYKNKYNGTDMYAMDFIATCKVNEAGYMLYDKDRIVKCLKIFNYDVWKEQKNGEGLRLFGYEGQMEVQPGTEIKVASKVIMVKEDEGWKALDIRGDLY